MNRPVRSSTRHVLSRGVAALSLIAGLLTVTSAPTPAPVAATGTTVDFYLSPPKVQGTFVAGADLETFNTMPIGNTTSAVLGVGTVTGGSLSIFSAGQYGGAVTDSATPVTTTGGVGTNYASPTRIDPSQGCGTCSATISLVRPMTYLGFYWSAGDSSNLVVFRSNGIEVARFSTADVVEVIGGINFAATSGKTVTALGGGVYNSQDYIYNPRLGNAPNEPFAYVHAISSQPFDEIELIASGFEFDNLAMTDLTVTPDPSLVQVPPSLVAVDDAFTAEVSETITGSVATNDTKPVAHTYTVITTPGSGMVTMAADGSFSYVAGDSAGTFTFTYEVCRNSTSQCESATVTITVAAPPPPLPPGLAPLVTTPVSTTTPPTTPAPTTTTTVAPTTTTTVPAPVLQPDGAAPTVPPGDSVVTEDGEPTAVDRLIDTDGSLVLRGQDFELRLAGDCSGGGCEVQRNATGREVIELEENGLAQVGGFGFMPGTVVHVWLFSEPTYLGPLDVQADGTFRGTVPLVGIAPGQHTLQVNGISFDGVDRSANLGVIVRTAALPQELAPRLPSTGTGTSLWLVLGAAAMSLVGISLTRRRPLSNR